MELLLATLTTGLTELIKLLAKKIGLELSKKIVFGVIFALVLVGTFLIREGYIAMALVKVYFAMLIEAVGIYHLILKPAKKILSKT